MSLVITQFLWRQVQPEPAFFFICRQKGKANCNDLLLVYKDMVLMYCYLVILNAAVASDTGKLLFDAYR